MFNEHKYCSKDWCLALKAKEDGKQYTPSPPWMSCEDPKQMKIYEQLCEITNKYGSEFYLQQSMHTFTTQTNEALNHSQAMITPKAKVFHKSRSYHYHNAIVIGTHNWGHTKLWTTVFDQAGVSYSKHFITMLERIDKGKVLQKAYHSNPDTKRRRAYKQQACEKKLLYENHTAEYGSGIGIDIGNESTAPKKKKRKKEHIASAGRQLT